LVQAQKDSKDVEAKCDAKAKDLERQQLNGLVDKSFTDLMIKKLNIKLEATKPANLISMLETFVALLRNKTTANHVDVKLYLEDVSKLKFKMKTIDCTKLDVKLVTLH